MYYSVSTVHSQPQQTPATKHQTVYMLAWIYPAFLVFSLIKPLKELHPVAVELHDIGDTCMVWSLLTELSYFTRTFPWVIIF